jgi:DNA-binding GntR family transcriptional regulator
MHVAVELPTPILRRSLGDEVYERLADELCGGMHGCGEELNEVALADRFQVSRTPVREALRRLSAEGLVVSTRNKRATVIRPSRREIEETYQVRQILEAAAARLAAARLADAELAELARLAERAVPRRGAAWGLPERTFDERLHRAVAEGCGNTRLRDEIVRYSKLVRFVRSRVARNPQRLEEGHHQHRRILAALAARDADAAEHQMAVHIADALASVLKDLPWA